jgi:hypothetical protein
VSVECTLIVVQHGDGGELWMLGSSLLMLNAPSLSFSQALGKIAYRALPSQGVSSYRTGLHEDGTRCYGCNVREDSYGDKLRLYKATDVCRALKESVEPERPLLLCQQAAVAFLEHLTDKDIVVPFWH